MDRVPAYNLETEPFTFDQFKVTIDFLLEEHKALKDALTAEKKGDLVTAQRQGIVYQRILDTIKLAYKKNSDNWEEFENFLKTVFDTGSGSSADENQKPKIDLQNVIDTPFSPPVEIRGVAQSVQERVSRLLLVARVKKALDLYRIEGGKGRFRYQEYGISENNDKNIALILAHFVYEDISKMDLATLSKELQFLVHYANPGHNPVHSMSGLLNNNDVAKKLREALIDRLLSEVEMNDDYLGVFSYVSIAEDFQNLANFSRADKEKVFPYSDRDQLPFAKALLKLESVSHLVDDLDGDKFDNPTDGVLQVISALAHAVEGAPTSKLQMVCYYLGKIGDYCQRARITILRTDLEITSYEPAAIALKTALKMRLSKEKLVPGATIDTLCSYVFPLSEYREFINLATPEERGYFAMPHLRV